MSVQANRIAQPALEHIGACDGGMTLAALVETLQRSRADVVNTVQKLKRRGLVEIVERGVYRITPEGRAWLASGHVIAAGQGRRHTTRTSGLRERAWWLMREQRTFTLFDLLTTLANGSERDAAGNLRTYISALERAGVLMRRKRRVAGTSLTSNGHVIWYVKRDLGRLAPVWRQRHGVVFDPNANGGAGAVVTAEKVTHHD